MRSLTAAVPSFSGVAFAGVLSVLLFGATMMEDGLCMSARAAGTQCNLLPPWFYGAACVVAATFVVQSSYWWWSGFVTAATDKQPNAQAAVLSQSPDDADPMRGMMGQPLDRRTAEIQRIAHAEWLQEEDHVPRRLAGVDANAPTMRMSACKQEQ